MQQSEQLALAAYVFLLAKDDTLQTRHEIMKKWVGLILTFWTNHTKVRKLDQNETEFELPPLFCQPRWSWDTALPNAIQWNNLRHTTRMGEVHPLLEQSPFFGVENPPRPSSQVVWKYQSCNYLIKELSNEQPLCILKKIIETAIPAPPFLPSHSLKMVEGSYTRPVAISEDLVVQSHRHAH